MYLTLFSRAHRHAWRAGFNCGQQWVGRIELAAGKHAQLEVTKLGVGCSPPEHHLETHLASSGAAASSASSAGSAGSGARSQR